MELKLSNQNVTLIDEAIYPMVSEYTWRIKISRGKQYVATSVTVDGHKKTLFLHNLIMGCKQIDHVNGDGLDNRGSNLRKATAAQQAHNRRKTRGLSKYKGVAWNKTANKWQAQIKNGKYQYLGVFNNETDAAIAYNARAKELFGEFAMLNEVTK